ncbi:ABC transporter ATP-binding protein [Veillonella magna]|uniref:ABC transporter ATP-binding protein n=2 Tax=Veillonella magna TaxID=464322 RepID=A0ABS2GD70_9FIRM|nr:ABC transporter ATP-binding protein [Veillonella magna]MBM6911750.1 ABC transporter ATP-binding protein [Veillonella magna]
MLRRLGSYIKPHGKLLIVAALFLAVSLAMELIRPLLLKGVIDEAFPERNVGIIMKYAGLYFGSVIISMIALFIENYTLQSFGQQIIYEIRNVVFTKLISRSPAHFNELPIGNLVTRVTNDTEALRTLYTDVVLKLCSSSLMIIGILISMYFLSVPLALVVSVLLPLMAVIIFVYQKYARKAFRGVRSKLAASNTSVQEMLNFIVIIKSYLGEKIMAKRYDAVSREFLAAGLFEVKTFAIFRPIVDGLLFVAIIAIFSFTNWFDGVTEAGTVFAFLRYINKFFQPLKDIADKYNQLQSSLAGAERLVPIINEIEDVPIESVTVPDELIPVKTISFEHVYFSYNNDDNYVLKDINFTIHGGDFIGIAGPSGGGKSTLMSLLMGFYQPTKGSIRINGYDIADYAPAVIREIMGYVFQDSHLFKGTIRENITLYDTGIKNSDIQKATEQAHLHHLIERLPNGYDTPVGYLGSLLSTGQKQLLALARVLVRARSVLIFDEATANIDSHTEGLIQESITRIRGEKTIISIAHRLSTIRGADCIYIIENGEILERGTYEDLMSTKGVFYTLWTTQLRNA